MRAVAERVSFDVLVVGSGASGLAAALSAERAGARVALVTKGSLQSCNSAKAQGGIQAAFGEDDSPEQHAEDVWQSSHETANRALVEVLERARELPPQGRVAGRQRAQDTPLEDVVQALALGERAEPALERRLCQPSHRSASIALGWSISGCNATD